MPAYLYCSKSFEERVRWKFTGRADMSMQQLLIAARRGQALEPLTETDMRGRVVTIGMESLQTRQAVFLLFKTIGSQVEAAFDDPGSAVVGRTRRRTRLVGHGLVLARELETGDTCRFFV